MNTKSVNVSTKRVNANGPILAIDLGKYKSVACIYERTEPSWQLTSFTTNRAPLSKLTGLSKVNVALWLVLSFLPSASTAQPVSAFPSMAPEAGMPFCSTSARAATSFTGCS